MGAMQSIGGKRVNQILKDSIARELRAVLTSRSSRGWQTFKSRFVSGTRESGKLCLLARVPDEHPEPALPDPGVTVGISFRVGHKKCMSAATLQAVPTYATQRRAGGMPALAGPAATCEQAR